MFSVPHVKKYLKRIFPDRVKRIAIGVKGDIFLVKRNGKIEAAKVPKARWTWVSRPEYTEQPELIATGNAEWEAMVAVANFGRKRTPNLGWPAGVVIQPGEFHDPKTGAFSMEYISGKTLTEEALSLRFGLDSGEATKANLDYLQVFEAVVEAVEQVHQAGYVSRDVKPENFLADRVWHQLKQIVIVDLGSAQPLRKLLSNSSSLTPRYALPQKVPQSVFLDDGLPEKMPYEIADPLMDIYSIMISIQELLLGERNWTTGPFVSSVVGRHTMPLPYHSPYYYNPWNAHTDSGIRPETSLVAFTFFSSTQNQKAMILAAYENIKAGNDPSVFIREVFGPKILARMIKVSPYRAAKSFRAAKELHFALESDDPVQALGLGDVPVNNLDIFFAGLRALRPDLELQSLP
jgi:hypothetical protein